MFYSIITCNKPEFSRMEGMADFFDWDYTKSTATPWMTSKFDTVVSTYELIITTDIGLN